MVTELQSRAQFSLWAMMASPLLISGNVRQMSPYTLATCEDLAHNGVDSVVGGGTGWGRGHRVGRRRA